MFGTLKSLLGLGPKVDFSELIKEGGVIIDVRTKGEFNGGNIKGSVNIPLDQLASNLGKLKDKNSPIITCCASGMRSANAKMILKSKGYTNVHNGGGWSSLRSKI
jgi:phage shock protein E